MIVSSLPFESHFRMRGPSLSPQDTLFILLQVTHSHLHELWGPQDNPHTNFFNSFQSSKLFTDLFLFLSSDPLEIQGSAGCKLLPRNTSESFLHAAFQGRYVLSFQGMSWVPAPDAPPWIEELCKVINGDQGTKETVHWLLHDVCPELVRGLLETGKSELEKQVKPEAWLSSGPPPRPGHLRLVCHVSGFYPKPVRVTWVRGEQEEPGTQQGDVMPNADSTWYLRVTLDVEAAEAAGLSCRVKHSSLGDQDIILYWDGNRFSTGLIVVLVILVFILLVVGGLVFWFRKHRHYQDIS